MWVPLRPFIKNVFLFIVSIIFNWNVNSKKIPKNKTISNSAFSVPNQLHQRVEAWSLREERGKAKIFKGIEVVKNCWSSEVPCTNIKVALVREEDIRRVGSEDNSGSHYTDRDPHRLQVYLIIYQTFIL